MSLIQSSSSATVSNSWANIPQAVSSLSHADSALKEKVTATAALVLLNLSKAAYQELAPIPSEVPSSFDRAHALPRFNAMALESVNQSFTDDEEVEAVPMTAHKLFQSIADALTDIDQMSFSGGYECEQRRFLDKDAFASIIKPFLEIRATRASLGDEDLEYAFDQEANSFIESFVNELNQRIRKDTMASLQQKHAGCADDALMQQGIQVQIDEFKDPLNGAAWKELRNLVSGPTRDTTTYELRFLEFVAAAFASLKEQGLIKATLDV